MLKFIKKQREIRLRKWCVEQTVKMSEYRDKKTAQSIYDWVTSKQPQSAK
jgi:hypothetical protein